MTPELPDLPGRIRLDGDVPRHVAVIMDGNGRWARQRGLPRHLGHREGMKAVRETIEGALEAGIEILTLFAFSTENWQRPRQEVSALMGLLQRYARKEKEELQRQGVEVHVLGELDRVDGATRKAVDTIVEGTHGGSSLRLNLMISYGGREEIIRSARTLARKVAQGELSVDEIDEEVFQQTLFTAAILGLVNGILRPILFIFTLPLTIVTLGLFTFVLNALMVLLAAGLVPGFTVDGFWWALLFSLVLSVILYIVGEATEPPERTVRYVRYEEGKGRSMKDVN